MTTQGKRQADGDESATVGVRTGQTPADPKGAQNPASSNVVQSPEKSPSPPAKAKGQQIQKRQPNANKPKAAQVLRLQNSAATVPMARPRKRHWFVGVSFLILVLLPAMAAFGYLYTMAEDRYASTSAFSVHKEESGGAMDVFAGLPALGVPAGGTPDADILYQFIQSQAMVEAVDERVNLREVFGAPYSDDPVFALNPEATLEELIEYWGKAVSLVFEPDTGLITLEVSAFKPDDSQAISTAILEESSALVNALSKIARDDVINQAKVELDTAAARVKDTRLKMSRFRDIEQIIDPTVDFAGQMGVITALQQSLANSMIKRDLLVGTTTNSDDPRIQQADRTIVAIERRIADERAKVGAMSETQSGDPLSRVVGEYESLLVDREFAEKAYIATLASYDAAVAEARRKSRYLAVHIKPTLAETAIYPNRMTLGIVATVFLILAWALFTLTLYSIRDRR